MAGAINLTPGDPATTFLLNFDDGGQATSLSGVNEDPANARICTVTGWAADGSPDPSKVTVLALQPGESGQTTMGAAKRFPIVTNSRGKLTGFNTAIS